jgi:cyclophilin family peptidyl-prolyl cis-trans isomerase
MAVHSSAERLVRTPFALREDKNMKRLLTLTVAVAVFGLFTYVLTRAPAKSDGKTVVVVMETSLGTVEIELDAEKAPITVKNFLAYVDDKFFDGTTFHRVMEDFMIQGGGFKPGLEQKKTKKPIKNEGANGLSNLRGTIAMARTPNPDSATAQFYINVDDNTKLDKNEDSAGYCVFGKVIKGMDVVDKIKAVPTHTVEKEVTDDDGEKRLQKFKNVPEKDVVIKSIRRTAVK